jgi:hypothetical protein
VKLEKIVNMSFQKSLNKLTGLHLPIRTSYKLRQVVSKVRDETKIFEEMRSEKARFYADKDANGNAICEEKRDERGMLYTQFSITDANKELFNRDMRELLDMEIDIPYVLLDELGDMTSITVDDLLQLEFIVDQIPPPKPAPVAAPAPVEAAPAPKKKKKI